MKIIRFITLTAVLLLAGSLLYVMFASGEVAHSSDDKITIRFGHGAAETNERHYAVMRFKELVEERSDGKIEVLVYPNELLGSEGEMIESVTLNDLQMVAASAFSQYDQRISVFELPYLFDSHEEAWNTLDGELGDEVGSYLLNHHLRILGYFENGFRHITANKPVESPEDLAGLKIRTPEFPISLTTFRALGASPTPMAFGELYMALQQKTVDAQENPVPNIYANKLYEVQDYLIMSGHQYSSVPVAVNEEFWQSLSPETQNLLQTTAKEVAQYHRDLVLENEQTMIKELEEAGTIVLTPDTEPFRKMAEPVYDSFKRRFGEDLVNRVLDAVAEERSGE
ncbi:C4-dicarboxylate ABC transporter substrate-binding protein [Bhargavaea cecembensis]|uniref:C4-dicarboxylate ABC transporter substrate-binding protein n=1 Tax=Bhargavaea cecembensis TaxID=394098 RepID=A0A163FNY3_9BACL|nr:TRAP transporter substrate-binding protein [Bhargavaea cecembensis]KZE39007.1 C4-dicarboxylate ABC transporter substrate-binding protein [Bhargavaea cecembensis]